MKALFQFLMIASMLSIFLDITSCTREYMYPESLPIQGKIIDIKTRQPIKHVKLSMHASNGIKVILTESDEFGYFDATILSDEPIDYTLSVKDKRYKIVNANHCVGRYSVDQVWYLERVYSN